MTAPNIALLNAPFDPSMSQINSLIEQINSLLQNGYVSSGNISTPLMINPAHAVTVTTNAGTVPVNHAQNTFTNSSAATMAITLATAGAVDGQITTVRVYDFDTNAETIGWTNTEAGPATASTTSNGSVTLPITAVFQFNGATSKWRCLITG